MQTLYLLAIKSYAFAASVLALCGNEKARKWVQGRQNWKNDIRQIPPKKRKRVWFHISSLGEYEQAKPLLAELQDQYEIVISFFSPSGYELKRDNPYTKWVYYLPVDKRSNADQWVSVLQPDIAIFVKYDLWPNYLKSLKQHQTKIYVVSAIFRQKQLYFRWYGSFFKQALGAVSHFFVQNEASVEVLRKNGFEQVSLTGDTRIDSVLQNVEASHLNERLKKAYADKFVMVAGSSYSYEEKMLETLLLQCAWPHYLIIAPHQIDAAHLQDIMQRFAPEVQTYSAWIKENTTPPKVLLIDNIGMLKQLYAIGNIAFVGGAYHKVVHNTLEPAAFGLPIIFGPKYTSFPEAVEMVKRGGAFMAENTDAFIEIVRQWSNKEKAKTIGKLNLAYLYEHKGATSKILKSL